MNSDVPEFEVIVGADGRVTFAHAPQARAYLRAKFAGQTIVAQFYEHRAKRTNKQNRAAHALLNEWRRADERLRGWEIETLKQWALSRVFGWLEVPDLETGEVIKVLAEPHTSMLSVGQFVQFIDWILEAAALGGVWLMAPDEYTKAKEKAAKLAARKARAA